MTQLRLLAFVLWIVIQPLAAQQLVLKTNDIQLLIEEWNIIHNARVIGGFENVYNESVLYYGNELSRDSLISIKTKEFDINPEFRQRIISDVTYTAYNSGIFKCEFKKEILAQGEWEPLDAYLLVSFEDDRYLIVGESDEAFDEEQGTAPDLGEELAANSIVRKSKNPSNDADTTALQEASSTASTKDYFTMPKGFIFMLIAFIVGGGLLIFITESIRLRRQRAVMASHASPIGFDQEVKYESPFSKADLKHGESVELSSSEKQTVFESYVLTLFDPLFFRYDRSFVRSELPAGVSEIIELVFHSKTTDDVKFAVLPLFLEDDHNTEWKLFDEQTLQQNRDYSVQNNVDLYYVVGHGGAPDNPHELYLLPAQLVRYEFVVPQALQPFRKTGMFFYNAAARKLQ